MKPGKILLWIVVIAAGAWFVKNRNRVLHSVESTTEKPAAAAAAHDSALAEAAKEADKAQGGGVTDNMTPDQVRSVLGNPDSIEPLSSDDGKTRERWIYRQAGKAVVFENGIAVRVESP